MKTHNKREQMYVVLPTDQVFGYLRTGKFMALSSLWKHESMPLSFDYELILVTEGTLYIRYMEENFEVHSGEYLILPPSSSRREGYKKAYCAFYWIHFTVDLGSFTQRIRQSEIQSYERAKCFIMPQCAPIPRVEKMAVQMRQLQDLARNNYPDITLNAMTTSIITEIYGQLYAEMSVDTNLIGSKQIYSDIADFIRTNISKNLKIFEIAEAFGYSSKYLSHLFTKVSGMSLKQFIMNARIEKACFFLTDSDRTISEIADELGFSDVHNFSRSFKKITGLTPSAYRNAYTKRMLYHV